MTEFEQIERKAGSKWPAISIYDLCIYVNTLAVKQFGLEDVQDVELFWSQAKHEIGIKPTDEPSKTSFSLSKSTASDTRIISCMGFINKYLVPLKEVDIKDQRQLRLAFRNDLLVAELVIEKHEEPK